MLGLFEVGMVVGACLFFGSFISLFMTVCFKGISKEPSDNNGQRSDICMALTLAMVCVGIAIGGIAMTLWLYSGGWNMIIEALSKGGLTQ